MLEVPPLSENADGTRVSFPIGCIPTFNRDCAIMLKDGKSSLFFVYLFS